MSAEEQVETIMKIYNKQRANSPIDKNSYGLKQIWTELVEYNSN